MRRFRRWRNTNSEACRAPRAGRRSTLNVAGVSIRPACTVLKAGRSTHHCRSRRASQAVLKKRIRTIADWQIAQGRNAGPESRKPEFSRAVWSEIGGRSNPTLNQRLKFTTPWGALDSSE